MTRIVGIGATASGDDGVGLVVVQRLRERGVDARVVDPTQLVEVLGEPGRVVLVDAVRGEQPGRVHRLAEGDLDGALRPVSSHAMSVPHAVGLARVLAPDGAELVIVGVEIGPPTPGIGLSAPVEAAVDAAVAEVLEVVDA